MMSTIPVHCIISTCSSSRSQAEETDTGISMEIRMEPRPMPARGMPRLSNNGGKTRSEEHTSELQSLMRISYAVFCLKKKKTTQKNHKNKNSKTNTTKTL